MNIVSVVQKRNGTVHVAITGDPIVKITKAVHIPPKIGANTHQTATTGHRG